MLSISQVFLIVLLSYYTVKAQLDDNPSSKVLATSQEKCDKVALRPYFEPEAVVGRPWRVYYMWNMKLENKCVDISYKLATPKIIRRIYYDMHEYLEQQPAWEAASMILTMGRAKREMLLFDDQGPAGRFLGVPNTIRDGSISPTKTAVPLLKFQMKLLKSGKYLFLADCMVGLASLAARPDDKSVTREEIDALGKTFEHIYGDGFHACIADTSKNDEIEEM